MHCSSSERRLDAYVDGSLAARERARVAAHLATCARCSAILEEFRAIDALLLSPRTLELVPNFTFKVMAEVRSLPQPHRSHVPSFRILATYLAFAWLAIGLFFRFGDGTARAAWTFLQRSLLHGGDLIGALSRVTAHVVGPNVLQITTAMSALVVLDLGLLAALTGAIYLRRLHVARATEIAS
jgi:anti-sigma factor RsiW